MPRLAETFHTRETVYGKVLRTAVLWIKISNLGTRYNSVREKVYKRDNKGSRHLVNVGYSRVSLHSAAVLFLLPTICICISRSCFG